MVKILHVSDTHLGKRQYRSEKRRQDFADALDQVVDIALGEHSEHDIEMVDAVIHTGDLFDDSQARLPDMHACQNILQRLKDGGVPFYAIIGNHERKLTTQFVDLYEDSGLCTRLGKDPVTVGGEVALYGIDAVRSREWETKDFSLDGNRDDCYGIVCMHQLISPPIENDFLANYEAEDVLKRFESDIDALALGDYHTRCSAVVNDVELWYPGSTERCAMDETEKRSVELLRIDNTREDPLRRQRLTLDTPDFQRIPIEFTEGDDIRTVSSKFDAYDNFDDSVVIVELLGDNVSVTKQQVYSVLEDYDARVSKVYDRRDRVEVEVEEDMNVDLTTKDVEEAISEALEERDFTDDAVNISDIVRSTDEIVKSNVESEVEEYIRENNED